MSGQEDDYSSNIDDQLLQNVEESSRIKVEDFSNTSADSTTNQNNNGSSSSSVARLGKNKPSATPINNGSNDYDINEKYQQMAQQAQHQHQQHSQQQQLHLQQQQAHHQQQHRQVLNSHHQHPQQQQQLPTQYNLSHSNQLKSDLDSSPELSEYNIQIPDPIIDSKSKIYPVKENTITAEGNLITRPYPEQIFDNRDQLNEFIAEFARDNGFGVVIAHSNKKAIYYTCELGGRYRHKKSKKIDLTRQIDVGDGYMLDPDTKTKKLKCPFAMTASFKKSTGVWNLRTTCNEHNHPQLDPLSNHPMLRKRSDELNLLILDLYKVGTKPSHIESKIKEQYPDVLIKREDIYNEIRGYKRKLKKQNSRFGFNNPSRIANATYRRKAQEAAAAAAANAAGTTTGGTSNSNNSTNNPDAEAVAAVAAAASANAFLHTNDSNEFDNYQHQQAAAQQHQLQQAAQQHQQTLQQLLPRHQQQQISESQQEEFQRQFQHQLDENQYHQYQQHLQDHGINDNDATAAAAIAAVANATRHNHSHYENSDLSMDNIDSRLVGE
ncbi:unnamed protein product [Candida verbasci]|uniref:FAR1 domain-containing protein n=1 Tax=Candida verbasci TaxID=1227364 RepID=A0A9W4TTF1_9ASCO|nr:unnamed protein product [Candida verbasci]